MSQLKKKWLYVLGTVLLLALLVYVLRFPLLRGAGNYLIDEDPLKKVEALFVLGGNGFDRGVEGARLYHDGWAPKLLTTGALPPPNFASIQLDMKEAEVTRQNMVRLGVPAEHIEPLFDGTSTWEEAEAIVAWCTTNRVRSAMILSDKFHTSRIRWVFAPKFEEAGIELVLRGAPSTKYTEDNWWENEYGLIMVNNEYVKKLYYILKY